MKLGKLWFGWSRNVALGVIWTDDGRWAVLLLGLCVCNYPNPKTKSES